ncbi:uncharacterized protein LOC144302554 [Canis aureus]
MPSSRLNTRASWPQCPTQGRGVGVGVGVGRGPQGHPLQSQAWGRPPGWGTMLHLRDLTAGPSHSTGRICLSLERDDPPSADSPRMPPPCWRLSSACGLPGNSTDGGLEPLWILLTSWHLFLHRF